MKWFDAFAKWSSDAVGSSWMFALAVFGTAIWAVTGPVFGWSDTWQLIINTPTTVLTFWWVILIQNTQNRDTCEIKALLREIAEDLPQVDDAKARRRAKAEQN